MSEARSWDEQWSPREEYGHSLRLVSPPAPRPLRRGIAVSARRAARARMLRRRRRSAIVAAVVVSIVILAWPGHAFGGVTGIGVHVDQASTSQLASGMVYVVTAHDSIGSIARQINPWDPSSARRALVRELGSTMVVAGEHVLIP